MGHKIDQFCEDLRQKLTSIDTDLGSVKSKIEGSVQGVEEEARKHLETVERRIEADRAKVAAAKTEMKKWLDDRKMATADKIAEWKAKRETRKLQNRAELAERYAMAARDIALAAADEAEYAALEAWLARRDADSTTAKRAA